VPDLIAVAKDLVDKHPRARLPCPVCATSLNAVNLVNHIEKQHAGESVPTTFKGTDGRIFVASLVAILACGIVGAAIQLVAPFGAQHLATMVVLGIGVAAVFLGLLGLASMLPARLELGEKSVTLVYALGLVQKRVPLPIGVQIGSVVEGRSSPGANQSAHDEPSTEVKAGTYVKIGSIVIGCPSHASPAVHWKGWTQGPARRIVDATLPRAAIVALEYHLAANGVLTI
jgi:hypothetical protein